MTLPSGIVFENIRYLGPRVKNAWAEELERAKWDNTQVQRKREVKGFIACCFPRIEALLDLRGMCQCHQPYYDSNHAV